MCIYAFCACSASVEEHGWIHNVWKFTSDAKHSTIQPHNMCVFVYLKLRFGCLRLDPDGLLHKKSKDITQMCMYICAHVSPSLACLLSVSLWVSQGQKPSGNQKNKKAKVWNEIQGGLAKCFTRDWIFEMSKRLPAISSRNEAVVCSLIFTQTRRRDRQREGKKAGQGTRERGILYVYVYIYICINTCTLG